MKIHYYALALCALFSACHSGNSGTADSKKDTVVVRDTVYAHHHHSGTHGNRGNQPADTNGSGYDAASTTVNNGSAAQPAGTATTQPATDPGQSTTAPAPPPQKKGWSAAAKDATIGGVAGAAAGALLDKNSRVAGGLIGAALGGGAGYLLGRSRDRKTGRVVKHASSDTNQ